MAEDKDSAIIPVKEALETSMEIAVVIKENGDFWLVHDRPFAEAPGWVEYDRHSGALSFITDAGNIHPITLRLSAEAHRRLQQAETVFLVYMEHGQALAAIRELPVIVHRNDG